MYPCTKCSLCCTKIGQILQKKESVFQKEIDEFPYKEKDGVCEMLKDKICSVYDNRPDLCNIEFMSNKYGITEKENIASCNSMILKSGLTEFLIK